MYGLNVNIVTFKMDGRFINHCVIPVPSSEGCWFRILEVIE